MEKIHDLIADILSKYPDLNQDEQTVLNNWLKDNGNEEIFQTLIDKESLGQKLTRINQLEKENERCWERLHMPIPIETKVWWHGWIKYAAAASIILVVTVGSYLWYKDSNDNDVAKTDTPQAPVANDVDPGQFKAKLILGDGASLILDSAATGKLAQQGNVTVLNKDGKLVYSSSNGAARDEVLYNTLETSKGQTYATVLSDGSKIWLNSGSSIRYPVVFAGEERKVSITGEAYFEVARDARKRFIVTGTTLASGEPEWSVEVLGTHFNINAYADEETIETTLLEGSVRVKSPKSERIIKPGQQTQLPRQTNVLKTVDNADVDQAVAWKNGFFQFKDDDLRTVMRNIARWYDVEVVYEGNISNETYGGKIRRNSKASEVLTLLEQNEVHFKIQGKKIIVSP